MEEYKKENPSPELARGKTGNEGFKPSVFNGKDHEYDDTCACLDCKQKRSYAEVLKNVKHMTPPEASIFDPIAKPAGYNQGKIEVWDFILDQDLGFLAANIVKYVCRYRFKGSPLQDLKKARAYLDKLISTWETEV